MVSLGGATSFWRILGEIRPGAIKAEAEKSFCILICGEPGAGKRTLRGALVGSRWPTEGTMPYVRIVEGTPTDTFGAGLALYLVDATRGLYRAHWDGVARLAASLGTPSQCARNSPRVASTTYSASPAPNVSVGAPSTIRT